MDSNKKSNGEEKAVIETVRRYKNTIFNTVETFPKCYRVVIGTQIMSEKTWTTREEAEKWISTRPWELILNSMIYLAEKAAERKLNELNNSKSQE